MLLLKPLSTMLHQIQASLYPPPPPPTPPLVKNEPHACFSGPQNRFNQQKLLKTNGLNTMLVTVYHLHSTRTIVCYMSK